MQADLSSSTGLRMAGKPQVQSTNIIHLNLSLAFAQMLHVIMIPGRGLFNLKFKTVALQSPSPSPHSES